MWLGPEGDDEWPESFDADGSYWTDASWATWWISDYSEHDS